MGHLLVEALVVGAICQLDTVDRLYGSEMALQHDGYSLRLQTQWSRGVPRGPVGVKDRMVCTTRPPGRTIKQRLPALTLEELIGVGSHRRRAVSVTWTDV